jgi:hypothetical protein
MADTDTEADSYTETEIMSDTEIDTKMQISSRQRNPFINCNLSNVITSKQIRL